MVVMKVEVTRSQCFSLLRCFACCAGRGPDWQFIDLLPTNAGKGSAMRYIQQQLGFGDDSTVASGDAMNDLLMLQQVQAKLPHA